MGVTAGLESSGVCSVTTETQGDFSTGEPGDHACKDHPHGMAKELVVPRSPSDEVVRLPGVSWGHVDF